MLVIKCKQCGKKIRTYPSRIGRKKYCSQSCNAKNHPKIFKKGHLGFRAEKSGQWKGGIYHTHAGYIHIYSPKHPYKDVRGYVAEHRLKMEKKIGRYLKPKEVIHHRNRIRSDNRLKNLQLFSSNSEHIRIGHRKKCL